MNAKFRAGATVSAVLLAAAMGTAPAHALESGDGCPCVAPDPGQPEIVGPGPENAMIKIAATMIKIGPSTSAIPGLENALIKIGASTSPEKAH